MSRNHYWSYLCSEEGNPINGAEISIQLYGTSVAAYIYTQITGGSATNSVPQVTTNSEGFFEFWVGDQDEESGYATTQHFTIKWSKPGIIDDGQIEDIVIYIVPDAVDETDSSSTTKNKLVSNYLAYYWSNKANIVTLEVTGGWSPSGAEWYVDCEHNLGNMYPVAVLYNDSNNKTQNSDIGIINSNNSRIFTSVAVSAAHVTFIG